MKFLSEALATHRKMAKDPTGVATPRLKTTVLWALHFSSFPTSAFFQASVYFSCQDCFHYFLKILRCSASLKNIKNVNLLIWTLFYSYDCSYDSVDTEDGIYNLVADSYLNTYIHLKQQKGIWIYQERKNSLAYAIIGDVSVVRNQGLIYTWGEISSSKGGKFTAT